MVLFGLFIVVSLFIIAVYAFSRCDGDLLLMWKEKFGRNIKSLSGQVVWITGASSGIGEHLAYRLARTHCPLVLSARREGELARVKAACLQMSGGQLQDKDILVLPLNVTDFDSHPGAVQKVLDHFGKIDVLINNAGIMHKAKWVDMSLEIDKLLFDTNVLGPVSLTQQVMPHMAARGQGQIVVISSIAGKMGVPESRAYAGTKFAINGYFDSLRTEVNQSNIGVTIVCPGPVHSNILVNSLAGKLGEKLDTPPEGRSNIQMTTDRCAHLCCVAIANRLYEVWMCRQPILVIVFLTQYIPDVSRWLLLKMRTRRLAKS